MDVQLQVSDLNFLQLDTNMIYKSTTHVLMAFFSQCFAQFSTLMKGAQKNFPKDIFKSKICYRCD